jgi:acyl dehydratase
MTDWVDDSYVGKYLGRHEYVADAGMVARYVAGTGDANGWYSGPSPLGGPVAPALLLHSEQYAFRLRDWYLPRLFGNLHIRQEWDLFRAVPVGTRLWTHGMIVDRYLRKDRDVVVLEFCVFDGEDVMVSRGRCHQSFMVDRGESGEVVGREQAARRAARPEESSGEPLEELEPVRRVASLDLCMAFSGPKKNYHNDAEEARKLGFPEVVVQGTLSTVFISEMLTNRFGLGWLAGGRMSLNLVNVLWGGEAVTARGVVRGITPEGGQRRAHLDVWTEKDDGTKTIAGSASALVG